MNGAMRYQQAFRRKYMAEQQSQRNSYPGLHLAICIETRDPWKQNRVKYFSPILHLPKNNSDNDKETTKINQLDWAWPISAMGGFDDCGLSWVPPAGTTLCLLFQNGNAETAFYVGTTWHRNRGPEGQLGDFFNYDIPEYSKVYSGHRKGYMVGPNDESQVLPPGNTDNYQGFDIDSAADSDSVPDAQTKTTWPHKYIIRSPEKHTIALDDGDPKCNRRWKKIEIISSMGHYFLMKDDPYHHCGSWTNPKCQDPNLDLGDICVAISTTTVVSGIPQISITEICEQGPDTDFAPCPTSEELVFQAADLEYLGTEYLCISGIVLPERIASTIPSVSPVDICSTMIHGFSDNCFRFPNHGTNKYHKHQQECFPFLEGRCALQQSGMQMISRAGHTLVFDDSVEEPNGRVEWEQSLEPFDKDGCTGVYKGRTFWRSSTGHVIEMNDEEVNPKIRGPRNGINIVTASGNRLCFSDHSLPCCTAGENRGIHMKSTANHTLDFVDDTNDQCSPERDGCGKTGAYSQKAFIRMRSGYGITLTMNDSSSQQRTDRQYFQIMSPQTDNSTRGPHVFHMQEEAVGAGQIFLRAGGDYIVHTYDNMVEVVGDDSNPSNSMEFVSKQKIVSCKDIYYNKAKTHVFWADDYMFLLAGKDCQNSQGGLGPYAYPVVVACNQIPEHITAMTGMKASEHIFASALPGPSCDLSVSGLQDHILTGTEVIK